jgi:hypothetical protein
MKSLQHKYNIYYHYFYILWNSVFKKNAKKFLKTIEKLGAFLIKNHQIFFYLILASIK